MLKARIFQTNVIKESNDIEKVKDIENQLIDLSPSKIKIVFDNGKVSIYNLQFSEEDFSTSTYIGEFENGTKFRLIRPNELSLSNLKSRFNCVSGFSIASINPDGYAIHFLLIEIDNCDDVSLISKGNKEQMQRLVDGSLMAMQVGMHQNFLDYSKRLLKLIEESYEIEQLKNGFDILQIMKRNINLYSEEEKRKLTE